MKKSIFVTGVAGSGKSSVSRELNRLGHKAYDIEELDGMFKMVRKDTGGDFTDYNNADMEKVKNADWICDRNKLKELLREQSDGIVFYCGVASNNYEIISFFNQTILLKASAEVVRERLSNREGTDDMGNTAENRDWVLSWKDGWENKMVEQGAIIVEADGNSTEVAQKVIKAVKKLNKLYIMCGLAFSGKSTLARKIAEYTDGKLIAFDKLWVEQDKKKLVPEGVKGWRYIRDLAQKDIFASLRAGNSVVYDENNPKKEHRKELWDVAKKAGADAVVIYLNTSLDIIRDREEANRSAQNRHNVELKNFEKVMRDLEVPTADENIMIFTPEMNIDDFIKKL